MWDKVAFRDFANAAKEYTQRALDLEPCNNASQNNEHLVAIAQDQAVSVSTELTQNNAETTFDNVISKIRLWERNLVVTGINCPEKSVVVTDFNQPNDRSSQVMDLSDTERLVSNRLKHVQAQMPEKAQKVKAVLGYLAEQCTTLEKDLLEKQHEVDQLKQTIENDRRNAESRVKLFSEEFKTVTSELEKFKLFYSSKIETVTMERNLCQQEYEKKMLGYRKELKMVEDTLSYARKERDLALTANAKLHYQNIQKTEEIAAIEKAKDQAVKRLEHLLEQCNAEKALLQENAAKLSSMLKENEDRLQQSTKKEVHLQNCITNLEEKIKDLVISTNESRTALSSELHQTTKKFDNCSKELEAEKNRNTKFSNELQDLKVSYETICEEKKLLHDIIKRSASKLQEKENEKQESASMVFEEMEQVKSVLTTSGVWELQNALAETLERLHSQERQVENLRHECNNVIQLLEQEKRESSDLRKALAQQEEDLTNAQDTSYLLLADLGKSKEEIEKLRGANAVLEKQFNAFDDDMSTGSFSVICGSVKSEDEFLVVEDTIMSSDDGANHEIQLRDIEIDRLQSELAQVRIENDQYRKQMLETVIKGHVMKSLEKQLAFKKRQVCDLLVKEDDSSKKLLEVRQITIQLQKRIEEMEEANNLQLEQETKKMKEKVSYCENMNMELCKENNMLKNELNALKENMASISLNSKARIDLESGLWKDESSCPNWITPRWISDVRLAFPWTSEYLPKAMDCTLSPVRLALCYIIIHMFLLFLFTWFILE